MVGQRVVVRSVVRGETGPSGGPALTDVLGVCEAWGARVVVRREDGSQVTIPVTDIVSGKPVPPRPSVRHRVPALEAELHGLAAWPGLETEQLGRWVLRSQPTPTGRLRKRANSCLAMGSMEGSMQDALARVGAFYAVRRRPALAQVEPGSEVETAFLAAGWSPLGLGDSTFDLTSVAQALRTCNAELSALERRSNDVPEGMAPRCTEEGPRLAVEFGEGTAMGRAVIDGDWLGLYDVHVAPEHRRHGWAIRVVAELLDWGAAQGATTAWAHVEIGNQPARSLWTRLGFRTHHHCRYLALGPGPLAGRATGTRDWDMMGPWTA